MWQGLEIYLKDGRSYFFNLLEIKKYEKFVNYLLENEDLRQVFHRRDYLIKNKYITKAWETNNISTYEYLLLINKYASRSLNDPVQYHVFPWIISNFDDLIPINTENDILMKEKLEKMNTNNENDKKNDEDKKTLLNSLRNFKYPLSLQNENGRSYSIDRYKDDEAKFRFHLGTHYSTSAFVFYYLMRQEPYDTLLIKLQNYQLENPNRMFIGMKETIEILESGNDNRELIPEFFAKIEFFMNLNYSFYGIRANKKVVNNLKIDFIKKDINSPITPSDYVHFIIEHKNLLNSDLINISINDWLNNIFGIGQYPPEKMRKDCCNIFRKTTYEKFTNLSKKIENYNRIKKYNPSEFRVKILNKANLILSFGQTPSQVFKESHPKKEINLSLSKKNINRLSYNKKYNLEENAEEDFESTFSTLLRPSKYQSKIMVPCIYFDVNFENNKIFALSQNDIVEINFSVNNEKDSDITVLSYQNLIKIPRIKLFENFNVNEVEYYVYKPKYAFGSFKGCEFVEYPSRKSSKMSRDSKNNKNVNAEKNFYFNNYYKNLFDKIFLKKNNDNQAEENNKFIQCRYLDNSFKIYKYIKIKNPKKRQKETTISSFSFLCEDFVSSCCIISSNQFLTGLDNGKLIRWNIIKEEKDKLEISFDKNIQAHNGKITAIEIDHRLGLIITCGKDNLVQIRKLYNLELITPIKLKRKYIITMAKVSPANFLYILCFDIKEKKSIIYGYTLTGIKFAKNKGGVYCNIDFTRSGNIVSLLDHKELVILNSYDLRKKENLINQTNYQEDLNELKNIEGASWLEFNYFLKKPNLKDKTRINNVIVYIKRGKNEKDNLIYYYKFKENKIFE